MAEKKEKKAAAPKAAAKAKAPKAEAAAAASKAAPAGPHCRVDKCKQVVRAKGYCRKHYFGWRRGAIGTKHRYKICSKEGCRKHREHGGLCAEHAGKGGGEAAAAPAAPAA